MHHRFFWKLPLSFFFCSFRIWLQTYHLSTKSFLTYCATQCFTLPNRKKKKEEKFLVLTAGIFSSFALPYRSQAVMWHGKRVAHKRQDKEEAKHRTRANLPLKALSSLSCALFYYICRQSASPSIHYFQLCELQTVTLIDNNKTIFNYWLKVWQHKWRVDHLEDMHHE